MDFRVERSGGGLMKTIARVEFAEAGIPLALAEEVAVVAREKVPVKTGALHDSIVAVDEGIGRAACTAGIPGEVTYAAPVEFGTRSRGESDAPGKVSWGPPAGQVSQPYMRPAAREVGMVRAREIVRRFFQ